MTPLPVSALRRLRRALWPIAQTTVAATLAVLIAQSFSTQRTMFVNQSVISAILIVAFRRSVNRGTCSRSPGGPAEDRGPCWLTWIR